MDAGQFQKVLNYAELLFHGFCLVAALSDSGSARDGVQCCCASAGAVMTSRHLIMDCTD